MQTGKQPGRKDAQGMLLSGRRNFIRKQGDTGLPIQKTVRWQHMKNCTGKFKGDFERAPQTALGDINANTI